MDRNVNVYLDLTIIYYHAMKFNIAFIHRHLHLELHKISREVNSIFEVEMTLKMVCYFGFIAEFFRELFTAIFVRDYDANKEILMVTIITFWLVWYICRIFLINYICERVSAKVYFDSTFKFKLYVKIFSNNLVFILFNRVLSDVA